MNQLKFYIDVTEIKFVVVNPVIMETGTAKIVSAMNNAEAICQEFSDKVLVGRKIRCSNELSLSDQPLEFDHVEEIKCRLDIDLFCGRVERMVQEGYCCTQVQNDNERKRCVAWFEPMDQEEI